MNSVIEAAWKKPLKVTAEAPYYLHVLMEDQLEYHLDLTPLIQSRQAFWRLQNFRYFRQVAIDPLGGLYWPEGEDIAPTKILHYKL